MFGDFVLWIRNYFAKHHFKKWLKQQFCIHHYVYDCTVPIPSALSIYRCTKCGRTKAK